MGMRALSMGMRALSTRSSAVERGGDLGRVSGGEVPRSGILRPGPVPPYPRRPHVPRPLTYLKSQVRRLVMARAGGNGIDLTQLDRIPARLSWPLQRQGVDPVQRLGALRDREPVSKLTSFLGMTIWLVTGDAEVREVLADKDGYSNDIRPFMGTRGSTTDGDIGGVGVNRPPPHTPPRAPPAPGVTQR